MTDSVSDLAQRAARFTAERGWQQFHDPKSLILALTGEVGELAELFQWLPADGAAALTAEPERKARVGEEMADVLIYLLHLANTLDIDLAAVANAKMHANDQRFSPERYQGEAPLKK